MRRLLVVILAIFCLPSIVHATTEGKARGASTPKPGKTFRDCAGCPEMIIIPAGSFEMGSPDSEKGRDKDEGPVHQVSISSFALGKTEITRGQFAAFVKKTRYNTGDKCWTLQEGKYDARTGNWQNPGYPQDDKHPVTCINWEDAKAYAEWISQKNRQEVSFAVRG
jgi:sulfatase modifying factor 1